MTKQTTQYWLFQANPQKIKLREALAVDALGVFPVKTHADKIKKGDKVILWQTGKMAGIYGLATVKSEVGAWKIPANQRPFMGEVKSKHWVKIQVEYNLSSQPITKKWLPEHQVFDKFYAGLSGTNYKATKKQYQLIVDLATQEDVVNEVRMEYPTRKLIEHPLNLILYGPPGTGKTYQTVNYALAIIENRTLEEIVLEDRAELQRRYQEYTEEGLIYFVTFHPSFSYEDFVEGIKPITEKGQIRYEVQDGIFKHIANEARQEMMNDLLEAVPAPTMLTDFKSLYKSFLAFLKTDDFENFIGPTGEKLFLHRIERNGNLKVRKAKFFGITLVKRSELERIYYEFQALDFEELTDPIAIIQSLGNYDNPEDYLYVLAFLKQFEKQYKESQEFDEEVPGLEVEEELPEFAMEQFTDLSFQTSNRFVLIIDEINRANIAAVFGDLISLIEPSKREGAKETLRLILPYSKTVFSVPPNLHIVATMNTADRGIEALDFALRRRFKFKAVLPDPSVISKLNKQPLIDGIHLEKMLRVMNQRIRLLLDQSHTIGHAYFIPVKNLSDLQRVFDLSILPLLKEYFYASPGEIGLVLGKDFVETKNLNADVFADFTHEQALDITDQKQYRVRAASEVSAAGFIRIYE